MSKSPFGFSTSTVAGAHASLDRSPDRAHDRASARLVRSFPALRERRRSGRAQQPRHWVAPVPAARRDQRERSEEARPRYTRLHGCEDTSTIRPPIGARKTTHFQMRLDPGSQHFVSLCEARPSRCDACFGHGTVRRASSTRRAGTAALAEAIGTGRLALAASRVVRASVTADSRDARSSPPLDRRGSKTPKLLAGFDTVADRRQLLRGVATVSRRRHASAFAAVSGSIARHAHQVRTSPSRTTTVARGSSTVAP